MSFRLASRRLSRTLLGLLPGGDWGPNMISMWRWFNGPGIRSAVLGAAVAAIMGSAMAQTPVASYGYSRATLPGVPGSQIGTSGRSVFPTRYYIFVEVKQGSQVSAAWAWVQGNYYECTLRKVSTPVTVESDPGVPTEKKETLVPKTRNDVYGVVLGDMKARSTSNGQETELIANNQAVVALVVNHSNAYAAVQSIKALRPAAAM